MYDTHVITFRCVKTRQVKMKEDLPFFSVRLYTFVCDNNMRSWPEAGAWITNGLRRAPHLSRLVLHCWFFEKLWFDRFFLHTFSLVRNIQHLHLGINPFKAKGILKLLSKALCFLPRLRYLDVGANSLGSDGAKYLAKGITVAQNIQTVNLAGNHIGADGAKYLAEALKFTPNVTSLDLGNNSIEDLGVTYLAEAFSFVPGLRRLKLWLNQIGQRGIIELAKGLKFLPNLSDLDLYGNMIEAEKFRCLSDALSHLSNFQYLDIRQNDEKTSASKLFLKESFQHVPNLDL